MSKVLSPKRDSWTRDSVPRRATIRDVANLCGLSKATVSRVFALPDTSPIVTAETRGRVMQAAAQVGYRPNWIARVFAVGRTHLIGLMFQDAVPILDSIYRDMVDAFTSALRQHGYHLMFIPVAHGEEYWREMLVTGAVEACVALEMIDQPMFEAIRDSNLPSVLLNAGDEFDLPHVMVDDRAASHELTRHLIDLGHRDLVFYVGERAHEGHYSIGCRREGFFEALGEAGLPAGEERFLNCGMAEFETALSRQHHEATAVVCYSHLEALPVLQLLSRQNKRVPADVSVASFNDVYPVQFTIPPLTTMSIPGGEMGRAGAAMLLAQLGHAGKDLAARLPTDPRRHVVSCRLIERESTGPAPRRPENRRSR
jgi:DNA-binding LacI/PurR family transcriptional regulator